ncbi:MAG: CoA transferase [Candidatus Dormibacteraeota bacterium]|nr:CoA transferase [Candidatus Dormibacteraeota bacterium]
MSSPLQGRWVLDLTRNVAGPYAAMLLSELGAEVVKVERPGRGDDTREWGPPFWEGWSPMFLAVNRNKRSITLDLRRPEAADVLGRLAVRCDILLESFRPGVMDRLGFGYEWARSLNPAVIYCSITPFGDRGPLRDRPGYDPLMQAYAGVMSVTGEEGGTPIRAGVPLVDMGTGMWAALSVVAALLERGDGPGRRIVTSLYETAVGWMTYHLSTYWAGGEPPGRQGSGTTTIAPYQAFPTRDGSLVIAAANDALFARLAEVLGHPEWTSDERFRSNPDRVRNRAPLVQAVEAVTVERGTGELALELQAAGVPCARIQDTAQVAADEQTIALEMLQAAPHPGIPDFRSVGLPFTVEGSRPPLRRLPPALGEHNREILAELGYSREDIARLCRSEALGSVEP